MKIEVNGTHYYYLPIGYTQNQARKFCGDKFPKGDLIQIDTIEKIEIARQIYFMNLGRK